MKVIINGIEYIKKPSTDGITNATICKCGLDQNDVIDSRRNSTGIARRRRCRGCGYTWVTWEVSRTTWEVSRMTQEQFNKYIELAKSEAAKAAAETIRNQMHKAIIEEHDDEELHKRLDKITNEIT